MRNRMISSTELTGRLEELQRTQCLIVDEKSPLEHPVCLFGPERYESGYNYPLVIWLHSCTSSEREIENVMPQLSLQNYVACAPRGTNACDSEGMFFKWGRSPTSSAIAEEIVFDSVELACSQFSINTSRIFLAGFGAGGSMAWRIGLRYPQRFAGVISIGGEFPLESNPLTNLAEARDLPTLWMVGEDSEVCGVEQVCDTLPMLHAASLSVDIRQYPCGQELRTNMLVDTNAWIMQQVTNQPAEPNAREEEIFSRN